MFRNNFTQNLTVLFEPTAACNMRCRHCYHAKTGYDNKKMSFDTLEKLLTMIAPFYKKIKLIWHGGEPLLMGYDFFVQAYDRFAYYSTEYGTEFCFGLQTNGTLLDEKYITLFQKTNTSISISYDGQFNDDLRQDTKRVEDVIALLKAKKCKFSCLATISSQSSEHLIDLYEFFKKQNVSVKFNPIIQDGAAITNKNFLISKEDWTNSFVKLFQKWFFDFECNIRVSSCCDILTKYLQLLKNCCLNGSCMFRYLAVDAYGNLYPCGRLISQDFKLANLYELEDIRQAFLSDKYLQILDGAKLRVGRCSSCKWFSRCHSGCNASASLNNDLSKPYEFDCYFTRHVFEYIENLLKTYDKSKINKYASEILEQTAYSSN